MRMIIKHKWRETRNISSDDDDWKHCRWNLIRHQNDKQTARMSAAHIRGSLNSNPIYKLKPRSVYMTLTFNLFLHTLIRASDTARLTASRTRHGYRSQNIKNNEKKNKDLNGILSMSRRLTFVVMSVDHKSLHTRLAIFYISLRKTGN